MNKEKQQQKKTQKQMNKQTNPLNKAFPTDEEFG